MHTWGEDASFLGKLLSCGALWGNSLQTADLPPDDPAALSPSKEEAKGKLSNAVGMQG